MKLIISRLFSIATSLTPCCTINFSALPKINVSRSGSGSHARYFTVDNGRSSRQPGTWHCFPISHFNFHLIFFMLRISLCQFLTLLPYRRSLEQKTQPYVYIYIHALLKDVAHCFPLENRIKRILQLSCFAPLFSFSRISSSRHPSSILFALLAMRLEGCGCSWLKILELLLLQGIGSEGACSETKRGNACAFALFNFVNCRFDSYANTSQILKTLVENIFMLH